MPYADAARNAMLDQLATLISHLSLHTAYSESGANEVTGGSPAYARKAATWGSAANGVVSTNTSGQSFDVPASTEVQFVGLWSALSAGTFYGMWPLNGTLIGQIEGESTDDTIYRRAHGLSNNDRVVFFGDNLPTGITEGTIYHVVNAATDSFQISTTQGGSAVTITADGEAICMQCIPETFGAQGTLSIAAGDVDLDLNFIKS